MGLHRNYKNYDFFIDGDSYAGTAEEINPPKLQMKTEEFRGAGMDAEIDLDFGMKKLEAEVTFAGVADDLEKGFGGKKLNGRLLRFNGASQRDDTGEYDAVEFIMRGRWTEVDPGAAKVGSKGQSKGKCSLVYYKKTVNGKVTIEIDVPNMIRIIDGEDQLADMRAAMNR